MNILLSCCLGASTSIVAKKIKQEAEAQGIEADVWAVDTGNIKAEKKPYDIVMLGPQVRYMQKKVEELVEHKVPVVVIDTLDYGRGNGKNILAQAQKAIEEAK